MPGMQLKKKNKLRHTKKQKKGTHREEEKKSQSIQTDPELTQMLYLADKHIKKVIITMFHMSKRLEKRMVMLSREMRYI